jgi:hypothetical protein
VLTLNLMGQDEMSKLIPSRAPNLPLAPGQYQSLYHEQVNNALRLYFTKKDLNESSLLGVLGMNFMDAPYISASDSTDQYALGDDTPTIVTWDTADAANGFTLNVDNTATVAIGGVYKIDFTLQFANSDNTSSHDVFVWLQENGTVIPNSSRRFTIPAGKTPSVPSYLVGYSSIMFQATPLDAIGLWWATEKAATSGGVTGVYMEHLAAQTSPYIRPANPSAAGSITFLSRLP